MQISEKYNEIIVSEFSTSSVKQKYIASYNGRRFEINESVFILIDILKNSVVLSEVTTKYYEKTGVSYTEDQIKEIINKYIYPIINVTSKKISKSFIFSREIVSAKVLDMISRPLKILFRKVVIISILVLFTACELYFFTNTSFELKFTMINFNSFIVILILLFISSFIHELGHASACKYLNINQDGIGVGLYLIFPVLYTNVSNIWNLSRNKRLLVNIAGVYFQFIFLIITIIIFIFTQNNLLKYLIHIININILVTLNPFFRFDGYWIVSDILGVPNLRDRSKELLVYSYNKIFKRRMMKQPYLLQINNKYRIALVIYTIIVNLFFMFFLFYAFPLFCYNFFRHYPTLINSVISDLAIGVVPSFTFIQPLLIQTLFLILFISIISKFIFVSISKIITKKNDIYNTIQRRKQS